MQCKNCGKEVSEGSAFCPFCGTKVEEEQSLFCRNCGKENQEGAVFCAFCGTKLKANANYVKAGNKGFKGVERILTPSLLLGLIVVLFICSFFIGFNMVVGTTEIPSYMSSFGIADAYNTNSFWFFRDSFKAVKAYMSLVDCLPKNRGFLSFILNIAPTVCLIAIVLNFASVITCCIVGAVRLANGIKGKKEINLAPVVSFAVASFVFAVAVTYGAYAISLIYTYSDYLDINVWTTLSTGSTVGIVFTVIFLVAALVLRCVAKGKKIANAREILKVVCNVTLIIAATVILVLSNKIFTIIFYKENIAFELNMSSSYLMRYVFGLLIDSDVAYAAPLRIDSQLIYYACMLIAVFASLVIMFAIRALFSEKSYKACNLCFTILSVVSAIMLFIVATAVRSALIGAGIDLGIFYKDSEFGMANAITIFVLSIIMLAMSITYAISAKKPEIKPLYNEIAE